MRTGTVNIGAELRAREADARALSVLPDDELLEAVQRRTFRFFWDGAHPESGLARDRIPVDSSDREELVAIGGSGFGVMALIVAVERGWVSRDEALGRLRGMLDLLYRATSYHGVFAHFINGRTGATIPFWRKDDGADLVETSFLMMGLLCARQYFARDTPQERDARGRITGLWEEVEWSW
ncbi:MAG: glucoamylase family protein, partial [Steroidobacteraceae bacterium]